MKDEERNLIVQLAYDNFQAPDTIGKHQLSRLRAFYIGKNPMSRKQLREDARLLGVKMNERQLRNVHGILFSECAHRLNADKPSVIIRCEKSS